MLTQAELKEILNYDPDTGVWTWKVDRSIKVKAGDRAGTITAKGYRRITIFRKECRSARLAHFYMTGQWPKNEMDHINREPADDRWENLREFTSTQNNRNRGSFKNNTSGHKGVCWMKQNNKWRAQIWVDNKFKNLGLFNTIEEAVAVRKEAELEHFGEFAHQKTGG